MCLLEQGEDMDADRIFVTSSMQEAMYLLEHCTNLAIGNVSSRILMFYLMHITNLSTSNFCVRFICLHDELITSV